jgi:L-lactate dehydrogenase
VVRHKKDKVAIIGAGSVGSSIAFDLCIQGLCDEIVLIDINHDKAWTEAADIQQGAAYQHRNVKIYAGTYAECEDADIVIITAAAPYIDGQTRLDMVDSAAKIIKSIVPPIMNSGFDGHFIVVTNPVDIMAYLVYKISKLPPNQVIGTGTSLDSARLRLALADFLQIDIQSIQAFTMGEHGDSQFIPWSNVYIGSKRFADILTDNKSRLGEVDLDQFLRDVKEAAFKVGRLKRTTNFAIAAAVAKIIRIIFNDENTIIPVSTLLSGEFGEHDVFIGVPAILNRHGVKKIVEIRLSQKELEYFKNSIAIIKEYNKGLDLV